MIKKQSNSIQKKKIEILSKEKTLINFSRSSMRLKRRIQFIPQYRMPPVVEFKSRVRNDWHRTFFAELPLTLAPFLSELIIGQKKK